MLVSGPATVVWPTADPDPVFEGTPGEAAREEGARRGAYMVFESGG